MRHVREWVWVGMLGRWKKVGVVWWRSRIRSGVVWRNQNLTSSLFLYIFLYFNIHPYFPSFLHSLPFLPLTIYFFLRGLDRGCWRIVLSEQRRGWRGRLPHDTPGRYCECVVVMGQRRERKGEWVVRRRTVTIKSPALGERKWVSY